MHKIKRQLGFILPFTLLLTVLLVGSCMVILQITNVNKDSSDKNVIDTQLKQQAAAYVKSIQDTLDPLVTSTLMASVDANKGNLFLADLSGGPTAKPDIVCTAQGTTPDLFYCDSNNPNRDNPKSISNLPKELFGVPTAAFDTPVTTNSINLSPPGTSEPNTTTLSEEIIGGFTLTQRSYKPHKTQSDKAIYEVIIGAELCSNTGAASRCQKYSSARNYTRTCPQSLDGKAMRPLSTTELAMLNSPVTAIGPTNISYPNLYCTCSDPSYGQTKSNGNCG